MTEGRARSRLDDDNNIYIVPVSGGKDSQAVLSKTVKRYGAARVRAIHNYTGIDHSLTYAHMKWMEGQYGVAIEFTSHPKYKDMWDLIDQRNTIPGRLARFCTDELKIQATNHWLSLQPKADLTRYVFLMGMRIPESQNRAKKYAGLEPEDEFSYRDLNPHKVRAAYKVCRARLPIVTMTTPAVFQYLRDAGEKVNPLYAMGHKRVGCYPCILAGPNDYRIAARDPEGRETIIKLRDFKDHVVAMKEIRRPEIIIPWDLDVILENLDDDPFGFYAGADDADTGCQWCAM